MPLSLGFAQLPAVPGSLLYPVPDPFRIVGAAGLPTGSYGDRTPGIACFSMEGTFGPGFGRMLMGEASKLALRPVEGRPEGRF